MTGGPKTRRKAACQSASAMLGRPFIRWSDSSVVPGSLRLFHSLGMGTQDPAGFNRHRGVAGDAPWAPWPLSPGRSPGCCSAHRHGESPAGPLCPQDGRSWFDSPLPGIHTGLTRMQRFVFIKRDSVQLLWGGGVRGGLMPPPTAASIPQLYRGFVWL